MNLTAHIATGPGTDQESLNRKEARYQLSLMVLILGIFLFGGGVWAGMRWYKSLTFNEVPLWVWCAFSLAPGALVWVLLIFRSSNTRGKRSFEMLYGSFLLAFGLSVGTFLVGYEMDHVDEKFYSKALHAIYRFSEKEKRLPEDFAELATRGLDSKVRDLFDRHVFEFIPMDSENRAYLVWNKYGIWGPREKTQHSIEIVPGIPWWEMPDRKTWEFWGLEVPDELREKDHE